ncbi:hypothetical protein G7078_09055 [Sphingomonas sinipercae]|uniref:DUF2306 domain-containing protein n=1 Tax=Sphingomonas sinipercae TaxID=2714944 RepID=A0A6G7ZPQ8_9SPHN|nr:hypothetical protein [Sphingomonas sinipercae]QIL02915.1 hypothetical protein G7078_09055 [Sphingomonas sinipercae]
MPYRHAHWYLLALFPLAGLAFWQSYISQFTTASGEFHAHGLTASSWLILLLFQSWSIQKGTRQLHRTVGTASLVLFPLFLAGGASIFFGMADRYAAGSPFHVMYAPRLAWLDFVGVAGFAYFYYEALRQRRKVHPHSGYMLATVIFLLPPIFGRLMAIPLGVRGPEDFGKLGTGFQLANFLVAGLAFFIAYRRGQHGRPFVLAGVLTLLAAILYQVIGGMAAWQNLFAKAAALPTLPFALAAGVAGVGVAYAGWNAGRRALPPGVVAA